MALNMVFSGPNHRPAKRLEEIEMAALQYAANTENGGTFHYTPSTEVWKRLKKMAFDYSEHVGSCTEKEALEACIDGIIEEGWKLPKL